jgi:hypothetical protein
VVTVSGAKNGSPATRCPAKSATTLAGTPGYGHSISGPQPSRTGSGIITSRSSIAMSTEVSDTSVSRNATAECVNRSSARVRCTDTGSPNTPSRTFTGSGVVSRATTWPGLCTTT